MDDNRWLYKLLDIYDSIARLYKRLYEDELRYNHNHDPETGRFTSGGNYTVNGVTYDCDGEPYAYLEIRLEKAEYASVISEINTMYYSKYQGKRFCVYSTTEYDYRFENHSFDKICIYSRI